MKALMGKDIKTILRDPKGKEQMQTFIGSNQSSGSVELSNGDTYRIMSTNSKEFYDYIKSKEPVAK
ncbi:Uncharacterised protein [Enterobacter hormaechei]|nr:hypothetical protein KML003_47790 [Klebsiella quasipneumoniae subsp. similipneumoniae]SAF92562.1 Uncharacterised protein [Enterobacter hormaechei]